MEFEEGQEGADPAAELAALKAENARLKAERARPSAPQPPANTQLSRFDQARQKLKQDYNIDDASFEAIRKAAQIEQEEKEAKNAEQAFLNSKTAVVNAYVEAAEDAAEKIISQIPSLAKRGPRFKQMIVGMISDLGETDPELKGIPEGVTSWAKPKVSLMERAAVKAVDKYLEESGQTSVTRTPVAAAGRSKPAPAKDSNNVVSIDGLSKEARNLFHQNLKAKTLGRADKNPTDADRKAAFSLAMELDRERGVG